MIELLPKALGMHDGPMKVIGRNFKRNFDQTWRRLGRKPSKVIIEYFRKHRGTVYLCFRMDFDNQEPYGRCSYDIGKTALTFSAPYFTLTELDELRIAVIGHELTHIYRRGSGDWTADSETEEIATRALAHSWGFETPILRDAAHKAELDAIENEWRDAHRERYGKELESRWLGKAA
jgi:hypothetical protein